MGSKESNGGSIWGEIVQAFVNDTANSLSPKKAKAMKAKIKAVQADHKKRSK
jgi:hypothetical protein